MGNNLDKLRNLTASLTTRDTKRVHELELYQAFFDDTPVTVFTWSVDSDLEIRVKNKRSLKNSGIEILGNGTICDAFSCKKMNEINIRHHKMAFEGEKQMYLSYENDSIFLTSLIPVVENASAVVYGCSLEVTHYIELADSMRKVEKKLKSKDKNIINPIRESLENNGIYQLINSLRDTNND